MMIKLQDFAVSCGVGDKAIYQHIKRHSKDLEGHIERKGRNGTWLDDFAQDYIRGRMVKQSLVLGDSQSIQEAQELRERVDDLQSQLIAAQKAMLAMHEQLRIGEAAQLALEAAQHERNELKEQLTNETKRADENALEAALARKAFADEAEAHGKAKEQIQEMRNRNLWERIRNK